MISLVWDEFVPLLPVQSCGLRFIIFSLISNLPSLLMGWEFQPAFQSQPCAASFNALRLVYAVHPRAICLPTLSLWAIYFMQTCHGMPCLPTNAFSENGPVMALVRRLQSGDSRPLGLERIELSLASLVQKFFPLTGDIYWPAEKNIRDTGYLRLAMFPAVRLSPWVLV